ncbi:PKD domain-containing protein [Bacteroidota bacterium]
MVFCLIIFHSCRKERYDEVDGVVTDRETILSNDVFIIDTVFFSEPIIDGQSFTFSFSGNTLDVNNGDIAVIQHSGGYIRRISNLSIEANGLSFIGDTVDITDVLNQYNLNDNIELTLDEPDSYELTYKEEGVDIDIDGNIIIAGLNLFQGAVENDLLIVKVENCTLSYDPVINRRLDIRTVSLNTPGINNVGFSIEGGLYFSADYSIKSGIITSGFANSIKILETEFSGYSYGPVPLIIKLEFLLGFELEETNKDVNIQSTYSSNASAEFGAQFNLDMWANNWEADSLAGTYSDSVFWDRNSNTSFQLFVEPRISFIVANQNGPKINLRSFYDFEGYFKDTIWSLKVNSGLTGEMNFSMNVFNKNIVDYNRSIDSLKIQLEDNSDKHTNLPPNVSLKVNETTGGLLTDFIFDLSDSSDDEDDKDSLKIRWDWDGDDHYDTNYELFSEEVHHYFKRTGIYNVKIEVKDTKNLVDVDSISIKVESSPLDLKAIFTVDPEDGGNKLTVFTFDASASRDFIDHEFGKMRVRWDWENDGVWDTQFSENKIIEHQFLLSGLYNVRLELENNNGYLDDTVQIVNIINLGPVADFSVSPSFGTIDSVFIFDASLSYDLDDESDKLMYRWDWENDGTWDDGWLYSEIISHQYKSDGLYVVKMEVKDEYGLSSIKLKAVGVTLDNYPPVASFTVTPDRGDTQTIFHFDPSASNDRETDYEDLLIRWDWDNDGYWDTDFSLISEVEHSFSESGVYLIWMEVKDEGGATNTYYVPVSVSLFNEPPVAFFNVTPETGDTTTDFHFDASGCSDNEDPKSDLVVKWDWENDGVWDTNYETNKVTNHLYTTPGTYAVLLIVKDKGGKISTYTKEIIVN